MSTATDSATERLIPGGTWTADAVHSNANFEVDHAGVSVFRGGFKPVGAELVSDEGGFTLSGSVAVESISVDDEDIRPHLLSPTFFDAEQNPSVEYRSTSIIGTPDDLTVAGELSMAGFTLPVEATGRIRGPVDGPGGGRKLALSLETTIDRTAFGMVWQMELPGGGEALANDVRLIVDIEFDSES